MHAWRKQETAGGCSADQGRIVRKAKFKHPGGRPRGVTMPCGWGCGARLTAREMREHFTKCPKRPGSTKEVSHANL
jgi:hypothetical protein